MSTQTYAWLDIDTLREGYAADRWSAAEVTHAFLDRIERLDGEVLAYAHLYPDRARAAAHRLDEARQGGEPLAPLHGVPVALKDLCDLAGEATKAGTTALGEGPARENAEVVDRLEAAGAIVLGKVKMTEGAFVEHHPSVTPPRNPWNARRWTGISSSGSGAATAAGLCTIALGTDTGGSIRYPSAACGLSGLKPTHGRISLRGVFPLADSLDHIGPIGRSVTDVARVFSVLCGYDPRDPWSRSHNPEPASLPREPSARGAVIGYDARFAEDDVDPFVVEAIHRVLDTYKSLGAEIVPFSIPAYQQSLSAWVHLASAEIANAHAEVYAEKKDQYGAALAASIEKGLAGSGREVAHAWRHRTAFARALAGCFVAGSATCPQGAPKGLDAILAPVIPAAFPADANLSQPEDLPHGASAMRFTSPFNLSGSPSLTLCGGFDHEAAPIGFQLVGRHLDEARLLELGAAYQSSTDHHLQHPGDLV